MQKIIDYEIFMTDMGHPGANPVLNIKEKIEQGWQPLGGVEIQFVPAAIQQAGKPIAHAVYIQTMVRYEELH